MKVLVAGFKHETNSFASTLADWAAFERGEMLPAAAHGDAMLNMVATTNVSATGFVRFARARGWTLVPSLWCGAVPSSYVTEDAFAHLCATILADVGAGGFDAIFLDLHGAAMAVGVDDAEGELLARIRAVVGPSLPIVASLDLHANVTWRMLDLADGLVAYRTYPHIDYVETGEMAGLLLERRLAQGEREAMHRVRLPFLIPVNAQATVSEPAKGIYQALVRLDQEYGTVLSFCMGFPASDFEECAPMIWGYGERAHEAVQRLADLASEPAQWRQDILSPAEAVERAMARTTASGRPVVIADTQDNPGGGGSSTTTGMLHALVERGAGRRFPGQVALGMLYDEAAATAATQAGVGATLRLALGAAVPTFGGLSDPPVEGDFKVRALADGRATYKGPKMTGFVTALGPSACLEIDGVLVAVVSGKIGAQDRELFRMVGIEPEDMRIIVVKSSNHFRADFEPLVEDRERDVLIAKAAGCLAVDAADLPWQKLPDTIRRRP